MVKYLGSKRTLVPAIVDAIGALDEVRSVIDLFSGTSRVGHALKEKGYRVLANDSSAAAHCLATCYVQADAEDVLVQAEELIRELNSMPGRPGYVTETFCSQSRYFQPQNGARIDAIRERISELLLPSELEAVVLTSLLEAADRVDSTTGVQMAYLKQWAERSFNPLELRLPKVLLRATHGKGEAHMMDARDAVLLLEADVAYIDPPYNHHSYLGNYHIWESLVRWDKPEVYGIACKRVDCRERPSVFNSAVSYAEAFEKIISRVQARYLLVSFSDEGFLSRTQMEDILRARGEVVVLSHDNKRYVGSQIGIYNDKGVKIGLPGKSRNTENIFICGESLPRALTSCATSQS